MNQNQKQSNLCGSVQVGFEKQCLPRLGMEILKMTNFVNYLVDTLHPKRRRTASSKAWEVESEQEEHSLSLSQHSSPSQSDQEQAPLKKSVDSILGSNILRSLYANSLLFHDLSLSLCSNILHFFTKIRSKRLLRPFSMGRSLCSR